VLARCSPASVIGVDPSSGFIDYAIARISDARGSFQVGDAQALPVDDASVDVVVSALMLNFVPDRAAGLAEMRRVVTRGGLVAAYVWDYPGEMRLLKVFWDTAIELDPQAAKAAESVVFDFCRPEPLRELFAGAGLRDVEVQAIDVPTDFRNFDDYWTPFLSGQAPAPAYAMSLDEAGRVRLRESLRDRLPADADGSIHLTARAWAVWGSSRYPSGVS
ncbi:MAG: hypothetical protein QOG49_551, partial [Frankiaceae bacterium]|nr:hypothetical protein [Frankiaceae bacterium]